MIVLSQNILTVYHRPTPPRDKDDIWPPKIVVSPSLLMDAIQASEDAFACYLCTRRQLSKPFLLNMRAAQEN